MKKHQSVARLLGTVAVASLCGMPAMAQDDNADTDASAEESVQQTIIVTAERRASTVQDTAFAIAVASGDELASQQINDPSKLANITPGVNLITVGQRLSLFVRGAGAPVANPRTDPAAAYSIDGVAISRPISVNGAYYDLARVEVLKGPQGTLYGRNSTVGAVNVLTNRPSFEHEGKAEIEVGNYDLLRTEGVINIPMSETVALRGAFQTINRDGYISTGYDDAENYAGRVRLLWEPSDATSLLLNASYYRDTGQGGGDVPLTSPTGSFVSEDPFLFDDPWFVEAGPVNFGTTVPTDGNQDLESWLLSAEFETDLGFGTLTVIPAYLETTYDALSYAGGFERRLDTLDEQTSLEVRLTSPGDGPFDWIIGGLYLYNDNTGTEDIGSRPGALQRNQFDELSLDSTALFGQVSYDLTDQLRLTAGLRYSNETKKYDGFIQNLDLNEMPLPGALPLASFGNEEYEDLSYRLGIEYDLTEDNLIYANVATGYKAGGFNVGAPPNSFDPEEMLAFTAGSKNTLAGGRVRLNAEAWFWDYSDVQQVQFNFVNPAPNFALVTFNAAKQESFGVEVEASVLVGENGTLSADVTYTDSTWAEFALPGFQFGPFNIPPNDLSGQDTIFAPKWSLNASYQHVFELPNGGELVPSVRTRVRSEQTLNTTGIPGSGAPSTMSSDVSLTYRTANDGFEIQGYVNNIEEEPVFLFSGVTPGGLWGSPGAPRTYGVRLRKSF